MLTKIISELQVHVTNRTLYQLSKDIGMPYERLWRIATGRVKNPRIDTIKPLLDFFRVPD
jgi:predicted transcriptional regulator